MTPGSRVTFCAFVSTGALIASFALSQTSEPEGHVTAVFHDVQLLPEQADARAAAINDKVDDGTALRTGDDSRSELTFADLTITRLGANTIFSFNKAGRSVRLDSVPCQATGMDDFYGDLGHDYEWLFPAETVGRAGRFGASLRPCG